MTQQHLSHISLLAEVLGETVEQAAVRHDRVTRTLATLGLAQMPPTTPLPAGSWGEWQVRVAAALAAADRRRE